MHNDQIIYDLPEFWVECDENTENQIMVINQSSHDCIELVDLEMFDLGKNKLKYFGSVINEQNREQYQSTTLPPGYRWRMNYRYPVFSWLHQTLNLGWLVRPTD